MVDIFRFFARESVDGTAVAFSPDGSQAYVARPDAGLVQAFNTKRPHGFMVWEAAAPDSDLCDIVTSPDGLSVRQSLFYDVSIVCTTLDEPM